MHLHQNRISELTSALPSQKHDSITVAHLFLDKTAMQHHCLIVECSRVRPADCKVAAGVATSHSMSILLLFHRANLPEGPIEDSQLLRKEAKLSTPHRTVASMAMPQHRSSPTTYCFQLLPSALMPEPNQNKNGAKIVANDQFVSLETAHSGHSPQTDVHHPKPSSIPPACTEPRTTA